MKRIPLDQLGLDLLLPQVPTLIQVKNGGLHCVSIGELDKALHHQTRLQGPP